MSEHTTTPARVRLSRAKGWRMPPNTVKVDRSTRWGNPFVVGEHGTRAECVELFTKLLAGYVCMSTGNLREQMPYRATAEQHRGELFGRNLACWCSLDGPCHADVLLRYANRAAPASPQASSAVAARTL